MQELREQPSYLCGVVLAPVKAGALGAEDQACYICYQPFGSKTSTPGGSEVPVQLPCGHVFGIECISTWTVLNNSCPLCRKKVRDIDGCLGFDHGSDPNSSSAFSSALTAQDDVWLDEEVWSSTSVSSEEAVSGSDADAWMDSYNNRDLSNVNFVSGSQSFLGTLMCGEHRGFCQRCNGRDPEDEVLQPPLATAHPKPMNTDNIDLAELGAQFADLSYRNRCWIDEYLNDPNFGERTSSDESVDDFHAIFTMLSTPSHQLCY